MEAIELRAERRAAISLSNVRNRRLQWISSPPRVRRLQSLAMVLEDGAAGGCPDYL
jgi:hypothetical protein